MDNENLMSFHICTSDCQKTKDCPICPHGYDEEHFCSECDEIAEPVKEKTLDEQLKDDDFSGATYLEGTNYER